MSLEITVKVVLMVGGCFMMGRFRLPSMVAVPTTTGPGRAHFRILPDAYLKMLKVVNAQKSEIHIPSICITKVVRPPMSPLLILQHPYPQILPEAFSIHQPSLPATAHKFDTPTPLQP